MNKGDLIEAIAKGSDLTKADAGRALDATLDAIGKTLKKGDKVTVVRARKSALRFCGGHTITRWGSMRSRGSYFRQ